MIIKNNNNNNIRKDSIILLLSVMLVLLCVYTPFIALASTVGGVVNDKDSGTNSSIDGEVSGSGITTLDN